MLFKTASLLFLGIGVFILMQIISPLISFKLWEATAYFDNQILAHPLPKDREKLSDASVLGVSVQNIGDFPAIYSDDKKKAPYEFYTITVPKIKLKDVKVKVYSNEFEEYLAQLPGTALPGERGNVFITGHSSISNTFQSKTSRAFFVNLPKMKRGDEIFITAGGQKYTYVVEGIQVVNPEDVWVINPPDLEGRYLSLMTCVPPGFNTKRLVVLARLK